MKTKLCMHVNQKSLQHNNWVNIFFLLDCVMGNLLFLCVYVTGKYYKDVNFVFIFHFTKMYWDV